MIYYSFSYLVLASGQASEDIVQILLAYGAPVNLCDEAGHTVVDLIDQQCNRAFATKEHLQKFGFMKNIVNSVNG